MKHESIETTFRKHDAAVHERATKEYRRRGFWRRMGNGSVAVFVLGVLITVMFQLSNNNEEVVARFQKSELITAHDSNSVTSPNIESTNRIRITNDSGEAMGELNDAQLLAMFPEGSCFIAEVNGKKMLVFPEAEVRAHFFN